MLPYIDRVGRRPLLLIGSVTCMVIHFIIAGVMASRGHSVTNIDGNYNLTWEIKGSSGMAVIAFSYIFTGVYGFTWVRLPPICLSNEAISILTKSDRHRLHGSMPQKSSPSSIVPRVLVCPLLLIGSSTLHWPTSLPRHSTTSSGRHTSFLVYSALQ